MFAATYVQNGAKVYIASRKEKQLREVRPSLSYEPRIHTDSERMLQVADALNKKGPGSCHYVVADVSVSSTP